ncbi:GGDEF domain-containing protein [Corallincola holothuriorum]|uniref:diguanylate cyclase n=1 Tax=Corallincola holothuriorum TaxID=2282215 RepID=A0A368NSS0_9GAMM|nr:GGDEF domain-containing protein [Corallincola holothuriorum]RCU52764.1 GGDEF domain-containing protein [Corallincola holothuriorum]
MSKQKILKFRLSSVCFCALLLIYFTSIQAHATSSHYHSLLTEAEALSHSEPAKVQALLAELNSNFDQLSQKERDRLLLVDAHQLILKGAYEHAKQKINSLFYHDLATEQMIRAYSLLSQMAYVESDYERAFRYLNEMLPLVELTTDIASQQIVYSVAAEQFIGAGDHEKAKEYALSDVAIAKQIGTDKAQCDALIGLMFVYQEMKNDLAVEETYNQALKFCEAGNEVLYLGMAKLTYSEMLSSRGGYQQAYEKALEGLAHLEAVDYRWGIIESKLQIAKLLVLMGDDQAAEQLLDIVVPEAERFEMLVEYADALLLSAELEEKKGNHKAVAEYYKKQRIISNRIMDDAKAQRMAFLQTQFETNEKNRQLALLEKEQQLFELRESASSQRLWILGSVLAVTVGVCLLLFYLMTRYKSNSHQFRHLASVDGLTEIYNRRHGLEIAERVYASHQKRSLPFTVIMADIDWFKQVNDTYGHAAGDRMLKAVASQLRSSIRQNDILARTGGEEFTLFLPGANKAQAQAVIDRCRLSMVPVHEQGRMVTVTLSYGAAVVDEADKTASLDKLIDCADKALYSAKRAGRDRVEFYQAPLNPVLSTLSD